MARSTIRSSASWRDSSLATRARWSAYLAAAQKRLARPADFEFQTSTSEISNSAIQNFFHGLRRTVHADIRRQDVARDGGAGTQGPAVSRTVRLAVPLASITKATARDGTLHVTFGGKSANFRIGAAAEKWAARITNPPSRLDKLGIKPGMMVAAIDMPDARVLDEARVAWTRSRARRLRRTTR